MTFNVNTFDLDFGSFPELVGNLLIVHQWLRGLGVPLRELHGIAPVPLTAGNVVRVKMVTVAAYSDFMGKYEGIQQL